MFHPYIRYCNTMELFQIPIRYYALTVILIIASVEDIRCKTIPNWCVIAIGVLSLLRLPEGDTLPEIFLGCIPPILIYLLILVLEGVKARKLIGRGDLKLLMVLGLHYEIVEMLYIILISCIIALVAFLVFFRDKKRGIALCPMITIGVLIITLVR